MDQINWNLQWVDIETGKIYWDAITTEEYRELSFTDRDRYRIYLNDTHNKKVVYSLVNTNGLRYMPRSPTTESSAARQLRLPDLSRLSLRAAPAPTGACYFGGFTKVQLHIQFESDLLGRLKHRLIFLPCEGKDGCSGYHFSRRANLYDGDDFYNIRIVKEQKGTKIYYYNYNDHVWEDKNYPTAKAIVQKLKEVVGKGKELYRQRIDDESWPLGFLTGVWAYLWTEVPDADGKHEHVIYHEEI